MEKIKSVANPHVYVESGIDCSDKSVGELPWELESCVDHASAKSCDVNVIVATYANQGLRPRDIPGRVGEFLDNTQIPTFQQAFDLVKNAEQLFNQLPIEVRKAMNHDPSQLEMFLTNEDNKEMLYKYGVFERKPVVDPDDAPLDKKTFKEVMSQQSPKKKKSEE